MTEAEQNKLVIEHMDDLVPAVAAGFRGGEIEFEDLLAIGRTGLVKAARTYDPLRSKFTTWATSKIRLEIFNAIEAAKRQWFPKETDEILFLPDSDSIEKIFELDTWGERGNASAICERWTKLDASPEELAILYEDIHDKRARFSAAFMSLTRNQRKLVGWVYLAESPMPIAQAARELGTSYAKTIRMLRKALKTMRAVLTRIENNNTSSGGGIAKGHPSLAGLHGFTPGSVAA